MPLDQRTLAPAGLRGQAEPPDIVGFDGGAPDTVFGDTIDDTLELFDEYALAF